MRVEPHFKEIKEKIDIEIKNCRLSILIALGWFTDKDLWDSIIAKCKEGANVEVLISDKKENSQYGLDKKWKELSNYGGKVFVRTKDNNAMMHNKFCIIDFKTVIIGSYNWSRIASADDGHDENIVIIENEQELINKYSEEFIRLKNQSTFQFEGDIKKFKEEYINVISENRLKINAAIEEETQLIKNREGVTKSVIIPYHRYQEIQVNLKTFDSELKGRIEPPDWLEEKLADLMVKDQFLLDEIQEKIGCQKIKNVEVRIKDCCIKDFDDLFNNFSDFVQQKEFGFHISCWLICSYSVINKFEQDETNSEDITCDFDLSIDFENESINLNSSIDFY